MSISDNHLNDVCLLGKGSEECRYLHGITLNGKNVYTCQKKSINKAIIDKEIQEYLDECNKNNLDPKLNEDYPLGNNCNGFLPLQNLLQGYDIK